MKIKTLLSVATLALISSSFASTFTFVNKYDNIIFGTSSTLNKTYGTFNTDTIGGSSNGEVWWQFDAANINSQLSSALGSYTINSITFAFWASTNAGSQSGADFFYNSNGQWIGDTATTTLADPASSDYLAFNNSGSTLNTNAGPVAAASNKFQGTRGFLNTKTFVNGVDTNHVTSLDVTAGGYVEGAITSGQNFTILGTPTASALASYSSVGIIDKSGHAAYPNAIAGSLVIDASPVPEPMSLLGLGLGVVTVIRRRKN